MVNREPTIYEKSGGMGVITGQGQSLLRKYMFVGASCHTKHPNMIVAYGKERKKEAGEKGTGLLL